MIRIVSRKLPNGETKTVHPFHICMKGLKNAILCLDNEDYSTMVKYIAICAHRKNAIVVIYIVVSNHCHIAILTESQKKADAFGQELKRLYSQWFQAKYGVHHFMSGVDIRALYLNSDWYVRNTLAYIPRNALDNGSSIYEYPWSGYSAMFADQEKKSKGALVSKLTRRQQDQVLHSRESLKDVSWRYDNDGNLIPETFCDSEYLEQAFNHDPAYFLKMIGTVNPSEMQEKLVDGPRRMLPDSDFFQEVADISRRWFSAEITDLSLEKKYHLLPYIWRTRKTTVNQLARVFKLERESVRNALRKPDRIG